MEGTKRGSVSAAVLILAAVLARPAVAGATIESDGFFLIADSGRDQVHAARDLDGNGVIDGATPGEVELFFDGSGVEVTLSVPSHLTVDPEGRIYLLDGGSLDAVFRLEDKNGDGDANDPGEATVAYDSSGDGPKAGTPNTLVSLANGALLYSDDGSGKSHLALLEDLNLDGDMLDPEEWRIVFDSTNASGVPVEAPQAIAVGEDGTVWVADGATGTILRLRDEDPDGTYQQPGEAVVWRRYSEEPILADVQTLALDADGRLYAANEDTGTIVRMEDLDGDGNAEGPNEAVLVLDDSVRTRPRSPRDMLFLEDGALYVIDANADTIFRLEDTDGDGIYASDGEVEAIVVTDGVFSTPGCLAWVAKEGTDPGPGPEPALFVRGDANSDDSINLADSLTVLNFLYLGGSTLDCEDAADVDDDGGLNLSDPIYLLNYLFLGGNAPLPPFETRGADPTEDGLGCGDET